MLYDHIIDHIMEDLKTPKRKTAGQDHSKCYHKITISVNEKEKMAIQEAAQKQGKSVSTLIKDLLRANRVIT